MGEYLFQEDTLREIAGLLRGVSGSAAPATIQTLAQNADEAWQKGYGTLCSLLNRSLETIEIPEEVTQIGYYGLGKCEALEWITFHDGITAFEFGAFDGCINLRCAALPEGLKVIKNYGMRDCKALDLTSLPDGLEEVYNNAFAGSGLKLDHLPSRLRSIRLSAFENCTGLCITEIPSGVTAIGGKAFKGCTGIQELTFLGTPDSIGVDAFTGTSIRVLNVPWSDGQVANAPWGATAAIISYDCKGE